MDTGPLAHVDAAILVPFPIAETFESIVAGPLGALAGADVALTHAAGVASVNPPDDLDALYASTVGQAAIDHAATLASDPPSPAPQLVGQGDGADTLRQNVLVYLPPVDYPITLALTTPPIVPGGGSLDDDQRRLRTVDDLDRVVRGGTGTTDPTHPTDHPGGTDDGLFAITLTVLDAVTEQPIVGAAVDVTIVTGAHRVGRTGGGGVWARRLPPGAAAADITADGYIPLRVAGDIEADDSLVLHLSPA